MLNENIEKLIKDCEYELANLFEKMDEISYFNTEKVLKAFKKNRIALRHFNGSTGYGYGDEGRDTLNQLFADIFGTESGIVSPNLLSGTHSLTVGLFGILRPNDIMLSISGNPYDTLNDVICGENIGSLKDFGVTFKKVDLVDGNFDFNSIKEALKEKNIKMVFIQRSRGYEIRDALSMEKINEACKFVRKNGFEGCIFVDNCYGEFVEMSEPTQNGVDICVGSLIKNAGGGIAPTGGYIVGKHKYIEQIAGRLTSPSIGLEVGSYTFGYQYFYQGVFLAPHTVNQAVKGSLLIGRVLEKLGFKTSPSTDKLPSDITRAISFNNDKELISFIQSVQNSSPVDSYVTLEPWDMPGYDADVIMAAGCFVQGSSIELSADAPIKEPYTAYFQGGLTYEHCKYALKNILIELNKVK